MGDDLAKLDPLIKEKDYDGAIRLVEGILKEATPESYDQCFLYKTEAQILTQKNDYNGAIKPLEASVKDRRPPPFSSRSRRKLDILYFLSQLYYQQADSEKGDRQLQIESFGKAHRLHRALDKDRARR